MIKQYIKDYFDKLQKECKDCNSALKVPYNPRTPSEMFFGSEDEEGYIYWNLIERIEPIDEETLSREIGFKIHKSLLEFINSYFFLDISGLYNGMEISFDSIISTTNMSKFILRRSENLSINKTQVRYIQIGIITQDYDDNLLMCFDNKTGEIVLYDYEKEMIQVISSSLSELISNIETRC